MVSSPCQVCCGIVRRPCHDVVSEQRDLLRAERTTARHITTQGGLAKKVLWLKCFLSQAKHVQRHCFGRTGGPVYQLADTLGSLARKGRLPTTCTHLRRDLLDKHVPTLYQEYFAHK